MSNVKAVSGKNLVSPIKIEPQNGGFRGKWGLNFTFWYCDPENTFFVQNRVLFLSKFVWAPSLWARGEPGKYPSKQIDAQSRTRANDTTYPT